MLQQHVLQPTKHSPSAAVLVSENRFLQDARLMLGASLPAYRLLKHMLYCICRN